MPNIQKYISPKTQFSKTSKIHKFQKQISSNWSAFYADLYGIIYILYNLYISYMSSLGTNPSQTVLTPPSGLSLLLYPRGCSIRSSPDPYLDSMPSPPHERSFCFVALCGLQLWAHRLHSSPCRATGSRGSRSNGPSAGALDAESPISKKYTKYTKYK